MRIVLKLDEVWAFDDKSLAIQTTVFSTWFMTFRLSFLIGAKSAFNSLYLGHYFSDQAGICHLWLF